MTTIARVGTSTPELNSLKRTVNIVKGEPLPALKNVELTAEQKAELAKAKAISAATVAASQKQVQSRWPKTKRMWVSMFTVGMAIKK